MNIKRLRYFFAVADEGNFSRAAERLGIAQPPLSRQVKQLEDDIGVRLFNRTGGTTTLTQAGRHLYENGRDALLAIELLESEVRQIGKGAEGRLNVGVGGPSTYSLLLQMVRSFRATYPKVDLSIIPMTTSQLHLALVRRTVDIGITLSSLQDPALKTRKLMEEALIAAVPQSLRLPATEGANISDLQGLRLIFFPESAKESYLQFVTNQYVKLGIDFGPPLLTLDLEASMCLVAAGMGICVLPQSMSTAQRDGVDFVHINPPISVSTFISHRLDEQSLQIQNFVKIAQLTIRSETAGHRAE